MSGSRRRWKRPQFVDETLPPDLAAAVARLVRRRRVQRGLVWTALALPIALFAVDAVVRDPVLGLANAFPTLRSRLPSIFLGGIALLFVVVAINQHFVVRQRCPRCNARIVGHDYKRIVFGKRCPRCGLRIG